ncbi:LysR family transcriptional regulator substrate-binding protein, partial [Staphylococcus warneri]
YEVHDRHSSIDKLLNFDVHFALTNEEITHEDIASIPLYKEPYVLITPKDEFPNQKTITIEHLPLIMPNKNSQVRDHLDDYFNRMN